MKQIVAKNKKLSKEEMKELTDHLLSLNFGQKFEFEIEKSTTKKEKIKVRRPTKNQLCILSKKNLLRLIILSTTS
jgi:hypothetical protein